MATVKIKCPKCSFALEAEHFKNAYCSTCDITYEADTEIVDIYTGACSYTLTGRTETGKVPDDYFVKLP